MKQKIIRAGHSSLAVIIPAQFVHSLGVCAGADVSVKTNLEKGTVVIKFAETLQLPLKLKE